MPTIRQVALLLFGVVVLYGQDQEAALAARIEADRELYRELARQPQLKNPNRIFDGVDDDQIISGTKPAHQPTKAAKKLAKKADKLSEKGDHQKAIELLKEAQAVDPEFFEAENNLALEYLSIQRPNLAIEHFRHLTQTHPEHVFVYNNLGSTLCSLRRFKEAEGVAREALQRHPYSFNSNLIYGLAMTAQGKRTADARGSLEFASVKRPEAKTILGASPKS